MYSKLYSFKVILAVLFSICFSQSGQSQENNYWYHNFGSGSYLKGGIQVGGIRTNSAVYYNPGALSYLQGDFFEAQADIIGFESIKIENGAGDDIPVNVSYLDITPAFVTYTIQNKKNTKFVYAVSLITRYSSNLYFSVPNEEEGNFLSPDAEVDIFQGIYSYSNRIKENWGLATVSYKLKDNIGIGLSSAIIYRSQNFDRYYNADAFRLDEFQQGNQLYSKIAQVNEQQTLQLGSAGIIFKPGISLDYDKLKVGCTVTTPNISLGIFRNKSSRRTFAILPDVSEESFLIFAAYDHYKSTYKTPWVIDVGAEYFFPKLSIAVSASWFSKVSPYSMIRKSKNPVEIENFPDEIPEYGFPHMAHKSVINFGIAITSNISENLYYAGSFRTDFNYFDKEALNRNVDFVPYLTYWNVYHFTSGVIATSNKLDFSIGLNLGLGNSKGDPQLVNMSNPTQENFLQSPINTNTKTKHLNLGFIIGFSISL